MNTEICIAQLKAISHAIRFWIIESRKDIRANPTEQDLIPYLKTMPVCPSGGTAATFSYSYRLGTAADPPLCNIQSSTHVLPP